MAITARSGKNSRVQVGATAKTLNKASWDFTENGDEIDTSNFESGGYTTRIIGFLDATWNISGLWDVTAGLLPTVNPPGLYPRDDVSTLVLTTNVSDSDSYTMATAFIGSAQCSTQARGGVAYQCSGKNNGSYTRPS